MILMDIQLPGMDGLELTRHLKSSPDTKDIIILALTAYAMKGDKENRSQTVSLDRRRFGSSFDRLRNTKALGW